MKNHIFYALHSRINRVEWYVIEGLGIKCHFYTKKKKNKIEKREKLFRRGCPTLEMLASGSS